MEWRPMRWIVADGRQEGELGGDLARCLSDVATTATQAQSSFQNSGPSMTKRNPIAFLSYVHSDDLHDGGRITSLRKRIEGEVQMQIGRPFPVFQDRNDIEWGQKWQERIVESLLEVTFLIPIVTPNFFNSHACRKEFDVFLAKETEYGVRDLILPLYYVDCDQLHNNYPEGLDSIADNMRTRQWADWRNFRHSEVTDKDVAQALTKMAVEIKSAMKRLEAELDAEMEARRRTPEISGLASHTSHSAPTSKRRAKRKRKESAPLTFLPPSEPYTLDVPEVRSTDGHAAFSTATFIAKPYYAFTKEYDEIIEAKDLATTEELASLQAFLLPHLDNMLLPSADLPTSLGERVAVTLLLDNSGSLRGRPILNLASLTVRLVEWLETTGAASEVLGFTTRAWKGGLSRETWLVNGKPPQPGRLNDLRHIIYKSFETSAREAVLNISLMMREGLLKENIDGEAMLWAYERIARHPSQRKLIVMFSDGTPVDDSTLSVNRPNFLDAHFHSVIQQIQSANKVALFGVGVGRNVTGFARALKLNKNKFDTNLLAKGISAALSPAR